MNTVKSIIVTIVIILLAVLFSSFVVSALIESQNVAHHAVTGVSGSNFYGNCFLITVFSGLTVFFTYVVIKFRHFTF